MSILFPGAGDEDIRTFKNIALKNREEAYQKSVDAIFQARISANRETYARLRKEDPDMYEALRDLMKDDFIETKEKGGREKIMELVRKKIVKNKSFDQIVDECESTPEEIRPIYTQLLAELQN